MVAAEGHVAVLGYSAVPPPSRSKQMHRPARLRRRERKLASKTGKHNTVTVANRWKTGGRYFSRTFAY